MHAENFGVYGARKVWLALNREAIELALCTGSLPRIRDGLLGSTNRRRPATPDDLAITRNH